MKNIYLDYAGATPLDPQVERVILRHLKNFGNASSAHAIGRAAKKIIDDSRLTAAEVLNCRPTEIVFAGSGTESANLAVFGAARAYKSFGRHIVTTKIEHHAVLRACQYLERAEDFRVAYLDVEKNGIVNPEAVKKALRSDTILVSVMYANNEIGALQPIKAIAKIIRDFRNRQPQTTHPEKLRNGAGYSLQTGGKTPFFHTDACQAAGALDLNVQELGVDLMTLNGSKIYGPKGTGCLFVRHGISLAPVIVGGGQERGLRAGTENPALIAGFAKALEIADRNKEKESARLTKLRDYLIAEILKKIPSARLNGDPKLRLPNNINISFKDIDGEMLMLALDQKGIQVSTGSACTATIRQLADGPSHVIGAIGNPAGWGNLRLTLGRQTTKKDLSHITKVLTESVRRLKNN